MRVGWLVDKGQTVGGAELTQAEFRAAAPDGVEVVDCPPGEIDDSCDRFVVQNCVLYPLDDLRALEGKPVIKFWHDVGPWLHPVVREWLDEHAQAIYCSPQQYQHMARFGAAGQAGARPGQARHGVTLIPPPVDLARFERAAESVNGDRRGAVCVGSWRNHGKAPQKAAEWAAGNGGIDFYGSGPFAPSDSREIAYEGMPALLAQYKTLVFLPTVLEPFGRVVAEAWASGCEIVTNRLVGAGYWLEENPDAIKTAAEDFWKVVLR